MNEKIVKALGSIAAVAAIVMYVSYIPQIIGNLHGNRGDYIQPLAAAINCILWVGYGLLKKERDWPIAIANFPGVIFGLMAFLTALIPL
ncbi:SemiSWEET family transporter [Dialister invisus]|uniref:SemiSWEET family transporter n=1 Tax=Dialister invisus TaxID=218538 RepID=UPI0028D6FDDB|nr:SemiSWEET family transporter [Dialister invisus]